MRFDFKNNPADRERFLEESVGLHALYAKHLGLVHEAAPLYDALDVITLDWFVAKRWNSYVIVGELKPDVLGVLDEFQLGVICIDGFRGLNSVSVRISDDGVFAVECYLYK